MQNHEKCVNNNDHADSKVTYLVGLSRIIIIFLSNSELGGVRVLSLDFYEFVVFHCLGELLMEILSETLH